MEGQYGAPFHFAVEFLVLVVALGGAFDALRARRNGAGRWAVGQALGFLTLAAAQFIHGALIRQADANTTVIALRAVAFGMLAFTAPADCATNGQAHGQYVSSVARSDAGKGPHGNGHANSKP